MNYKDYITIDPNKRGGKPCVRGLRITVYEVLEYLASEMTEEEILDDFPDLTREDLKACIAFAADRERRLMMVPIDDDFRLDAEYMAACGKEADPSITLESVRRILARVPGSISDDIVAERNERF